MTSPVKDLNRAALRGEPSYVWRAGQVRRLKLIQTAAGERTAGRLLDNGCGVGAYLEHLAVGARQACGIEFDPERTRQASVRWPQVAIAAGEDLPFADASFDLVLSHEVLEHVADDRRALGEIARVLQPPASDQLAGRLVLFVPNRGYPFETHGVYWRGRYRFGNIPLVNYLPQRLRDKLAPHVRVYTRRQLQRLIAPLPLQIIEHRILFGAYDNIIARWPGVGRLLRALLQTLERTPLRIFGLSHFIVLQRTDS